jgi:phage tail sheath protein FI
VLVTRVISVLGKAGKTGSLYKSLKAISDQVSTRVIVVRVAKAGTGENGHAVAADYRRHAG